MRNPLCPHCDNETHGKHRKGCPMNSQNEECAKATPNTRGIEMEREALSKLIKDTMDFYESCDSLMRPEEDVIAEAILQARAAMQGGLEEGHIRYVISGLSIVPLATYSSIEAALLGGTE